jgi:restriction endonuclease S subunit
MLSFKIYSKDLEDRFLVPFYHVKEKTKKYKLTIGDISEQITNGMDLREYKDEGTPYLRGVDIKRCQIDMLTPKLVNFSLKNIPDKLKLSSGDIVITRKGTAGITSIISDDCKDVIIGTEIIKVRLNKDSEISPEYLYTLLNSKIGILQINAKLTGSISRGINHPSLKKIKVPKLSEEEHNKIDSWVKEAKTKHSKSLKLIEEAKQKLLSLFQKYEPREEKYFKTYSEDIDDNFFTPQFYYPLYNKTIDRMRKDFEIIKLGEISDIQRGNEVGSENYRTYIDKVNTDVSFIRTSDLPNYEIDDWTDYYVDESIYENLNQDVRPRDIVFSNDGKIGFSAIVTEADKGVLQSHIRRIRMLKKLSPEYVLIFLNTKYGKFQIKKRVVVQATIPTIGDGLKEIEIPKIPENIEKEITKLVREAYKLKAQKKLLIRKAKKLIENVVLGE